MNLKPEALRYSKPRDKNKEKESLEKRRKVIVVSGLGFHVGMGFGAILGKYGLTQKYFTRLGKPQPELSSYSKGHRGMPLEFFILCMKEVGFSKEETGKFLEEILQEHTDYLGSILSEELEQQFSSSSSDQVEH